MEAVANRLPGEAQIHFQAARNKAVHMLRTTAITPETEPHLRAMALHFFRHGQAARFKPYFRSYLVAIAESNRRAGRLAEARALLGEIGHEDADPALKAQMLVRARACIPQAPGSPEYLAALDEVTRQVTTLSVEDCAVAGLRRIKEGPVWEGLQFLILAGGETQRRAVPVLWSRNKQRLGKRAQETVRRTFKVMFGEDLPA